MELKKPGASSLAGGSLVAVFADEDPSSASFVLPGSHTGGAHCI